MRTQGIALVASGLALIVCCEDNPWLLELPDERDEHTGLQYVAGPQLEPP